MGRSHSTAGASSMTGLEPLADRLAVLARRRLHQRGHLVRAGLGLDVDHVPASDQLLGFRDRPVTIGAASGPPYRT